MRKFLEIVLFIIIAIFVLLILIATGLMSKIDISLDIALAIVKVLAIGIYLCIFTYFLANTINNNGFSLLATLGFFIGVGLVAIIILTGKGASWVQSVLYIDIGLMLINSTRTSSEIHKKFKYATMGLLLITFLTSAIMDGIESSISSDPLSAISSISSGFASDMGTVMSVLYLITLCAIICNPIIGAITNTLADEGIESYQILDAPAATNEQINQYNANNTNLPFDIRGPEHAKQVQEEAMKASQVDNLVESPVTPESMPTPINTLENGPTGNPNNNNFS